MDTPSQAGEAELLLTGSYRGEEKAGNEATPSQGSMQGRA